MAYLSLASTSAHARDLHVLHWWKSTSERQAVAILTARVRQAGFGWVDENVSEVAGVPIVLRSRILTQNLPDIVQATSLASYNWTRLGLVTELDDLGAADHWEDRLLPAVYQQIRPGKHVLAVPLAVHRLNTLVFNAPAFARLRLSPPQSWNDFERIAPILERAGMVPLAQSSEPWQVMTLFENLLLAGGGIALHERLYVDNDARAFMGSEFAGALRQLRGLKRWMRHPVPETHWSVLANELRNGEAAMAVSGDWLKGELQAGGGQVGKTFGCTTAPGTAKIHLLNLDTLVMMRSRRISAAAQEQVARLAVSPQLQARFNRAKGSVPVLRNVDLASMDSCARASWTSLIDPGVAVVRSDAIGLLGGESMRDAFISEVHQFFMDDSIAVEDTQRRLAAISRAFSQDPTP